MNENFCHAVADAVASKKVVIYGASYMGSVMLNIMKKLEKEVIFFLDRNPDKQKKGFFGYQVKAPEEILYEDMTTTIVVIAVGTRKKEVEDLLTSFGLKKGVEFIHGATMRCMACDAIDPLLGYCRSSDPHGFKNMGEDYRSKKKNILCLGGSTTDYSFYGIKSWPEYLFELFRHDNIDINVLNGGVIGYNSSQELLKLMRDGLELAPSLVVSYSGVNDMGNLDPVPAMGAKYLNDLWQTLIPENDIRSEVFSDELSGVHYAKTSLDSAEYWYRNEKMMYNICCGFSIPFLGILQPSLYTKNIEERPLNEQRLFNTIAGSNKYTEEQFRKAEQFEKAKQLVNQDRDGCLIDFTALFDEDLDVYADYCHVFEEGNKIIAESIYRIIKERKIFDI